MIAAVPVAAGYCDGDAGEKQTQLWRVGHVRFRRTLSNEITVQERHTQIRVETTRQDNV